jgi:hypothetical protein
VSSEAPDDRQDAVTCRQDRAFNKGSDDCLLGVPASCCPYTDVVTNGKALSVCWHKGWEHAWNYWGSDVARNGVLRWPYLSLQAHESRMALLEAGRCAERRLKVKEARC